MGRMRVGHVALPVAAAVVVAGATATFWLPLLTDAGRAGESWEASASASTGVLAAGSASETASETVVSTDPADLIRFGSKTAKPRPSGSVRLATYNVENLFDDVDDPALTGKYEDKDLAKPELELRGAAAAIRALDADVLAVEEVESIDALRWFRDHWLKDLGYEYIASVDAGDERGIEQGVLSRFPITGIKNWPGLALEGVHPEKAPDAEAGSSLKLHRSPLKVEVVLGGEGATSQVLTLFVVHHKSGAKSAYWREAEAKKVVELVHAEEAASPGRAIAILGDFNATPEQASVKTYLTGGFIDVFGDRVQGDPAWITHESGRTIDLILGNRALVEHIASGSHFVLGVPARPAGSDWKTTPPPEGYASDHYPVAVDLSFPGVKLPVRGAGTHGGSKSEHVADKAGPAGGGSR